MSADDDDDVQLLLLVVVVPIPETHSNPIEIQKSDELNSYFTTCILSPCCLVALQTYVTGLGWTARPLARAHRNQMLLLCLVARLLQHLTKTHFVRHNNGDGDNDDDDGGDDDKRQQQVSKFKRRAMGKSIS